MKNAIEVRNLSKKYSIHHEGVKQARSLRELLSFPSPILQSRIEKIEVKSSREDFWALKDISFEVPEGQRIAVIGGNGAGKSTLLKLLSRITEPTSGSIKIRGKVASLLEVGTGFHPELTGRENIFLNGAILGMRHNEILKKFDSIVDFSGVEKFIDTPVKHYSSGMYVRLAFSVSAWLNPDILIVDEVLSVGDMAFQKRCAERMKELTGDGRTVIFVSHSMAAVRSMCEKAIVLNQGKVAFVGAVNEGVDLYGQLILGGDEAYKWERASFQYQEGITEKYIDALSVDGYVECISGEIKNAHKVTKSSISIAESFNVVMKYRVLKQINGTLVPSLHFYDANGERFFVAMPEKCAPANIGEHEISCEVPEFLCNTGKYTIALVMCTFEWDRSVHFSLPNALRFEVTENELDDPRRHGFQGSLPGLTRPRLNWKVLSDRNF